MTVSAGERRTPISTVSGSRKTHAASRSISGGNVAENRSVCRSVRNFFDDSAHVGQETHVEHAIDFIEHENADVAEIQRALFQMIEQASGRRDDDVDSARGFFRLLAVTDAAVHDRYAKIGKASVIAKCGFDLGGEFARRLENETAKIAVLGEQRQNRQREGRGFAGAGLRGADQIFAGKNDWECAELNRRRLGKAHRLGAANHFRGKTEIFK